MQDELDDILRYGAAELFADAVAASKTKAEETVNAGWSLRLLVSCICEPGHQYLQPLEIQDITTRLSSCACLS